MNPTVKQEADNQHKINLFIFFSFNVKACSQPSSKAKAQTLDPPLNTSVPQLNTKEPRTTTNKLFSNKNHHTSYKFLAFNTT